MIHGAILACIAGLAVAYWLGRRRREWPDLRDEILAERPAVARLVARKKKK